MGTRHAIGETCVYCAHNGRAVCSSTRAFPPEGHAMTQCTEADADSRGHVKVLKWVCNVGMVTDSTSRASMIEQAGGHDVAVA